MYQKAGGAAVNYGWPVYPPRSTQGGKTSFLTSAANGLNSTNMTVHLVILLTNTLKQKICPTYKHQMLDVHPFCSRHVWELTKLIKTWQLKSKQWRVNNVTAIFLMDLMISCSVYILKAAKNRFPPLAFCFFPTLSAF